MSHQRPRKYELTSESQSLLGRTVYRIRRHDGVLGGWVESEANLAQDGNCWISDEAAAVADARVVGNAQVRNLAIVSGRATIMENATIGGTARVFGSSIINGVAAILDSASVSGATITDSAIVEGHAVIAGPVTMRGLTRASGASQLSGKILLCGHTIVGGHVVLVGGSQDAPPLFIERADCDPPITQEPPEAQQSDTDEGFTWRFLGREGVVSALDAPVSPSPGARPVAPRSAATLSAQTSLQHVPPSMPLATQTFPGFTVVVGQVTAADRPVSVTTLWSLPTGGTSVSVQLFGAAVPPIEIVSAVRLSGPPELNDQLSQEALRAWLTATLLKHREALNIDTTLWSRHETEVIETTGPVVAGHAGRRLTFRREGS